MGLRGFKAKLFKRTKNKTSEIVCLSYNLNPEVYGSPAPINGIQERQEIGKHEVVKQRRTVTKPVVQNIFSENATAPQPKPDFFKLDFLGMTKKSNLKKSPHEQAKNENPKHKEDSNGVNMQDNRVSTLIHMTSGHDEESGKDDNEYTEIIATPHKKEKEQKFYGAKYSGKNIRSAPKETQQSTAESLFFSDSSPVVEHRPRNLHLTDYGDRLSLSSQTSA